VEPDGEEALAMTKQRRSIASSESADAWWATCPKCGAQRKTIYDRCAKCKTAIAELVLIAPKAVAAEAVKRLEQEAIRVRLGPGEHPTVRVPPRSAEAARKLLAPLAARRDNASGYTLVVTGPTAFATAAGKKLTRAGLRFERKPAPGKRVTIRVPILQNGTGIDEVYPLEVSLIHRDEESYWRCLDCGRGFDSSVNYCPGCRAFVGDAHAM
jgi:hypothetical protein